MDYNNMKDEEIVEKIESGEIKYVGDFFINHNHNFNMTKAIAIANRNIGKDKVIVKEIFKNLFGYEEISVHGVGFDMDAYYVIGYSNYIMNKTKSLKVNIDIGEYLNALGVKNISNKVRYKKEILNSIRDIYNTSFEIKLNGRKYGRKIFAGYDYSDEGDIISVYFDPSFVSLQSSDKILISGSLSQYKQIKRDISLSVLDILRANNYKNHSNEIYYADLKASIISGAKRVSRINENFKRAFDDLVSKGFAEFCYFEELPNKKVVVKFKLTKKGLMQDTSSVEKVKPAIAEPVAAPVIPKPVAIEQAPIDYSSMSLEEKLKALESTMVRLGVNPESLVQDPVSAVKTDWKSWEDENIDDADFIEADNDFSKSAPDNNSCNDELPF